MALEYKTREIRATGRTPEAVSADLADLLNAETTEGWVFDRLQPIIFNSSTTGYFIAIFSRPRTESP